MSSSASPAPSRRKTLLSLGVLALLTGIVVFIFREHWAEISEALKKSVEALNEAQNALTNITAAVQQEYSQRQQAASMQ